MKKLLLYGLLILMSACSSPEKKAKKLIKNELYLTINDFKSYEPVSFSGLDSLFSTYEMDSNYIKNEKLKITLKEYSKVCEQRFQENRNDIIYSSRGGEWAKDISIVVVNIVFEGSWYQKTHDTIIKNFKPKFIGYKMTHKYRAKNAIGGTSIDERIFYFDPMLTKLFIPTTLKNDTTTISPKDIVLLMVRMKSDPSESHLFPR